MSGSEGEILEVCYHKMHSKAPERNVWDFMKLTFVFVHMSCLIVKHTRQCVHAFLFILGFFFTIIIIFLFILCHLNS